MSGLFLDYEVYFKVIISAILGFLIGWDRTSKNKPAGLKTYMYVALSTTLITIISIESVSKYSDLHFGVRMDPMRLAAQIVSGLGFLGAGVILKDGLRVKGLTSAAMIFFVGAVGIGIGAGYYGVVFLSVTIAAILTSVGNYFEDQEIVNIPKRVIRKRRRSKKR